MTSARTRFPVLAPSTNASASSEHERGERLERVHGALRRVVDPTAAVPSDEPEGDRDDHRTDDRREADEHRDPGRVDEPAQLVAAEMVGSEPVVTRGGQELVGELVVRVVGREERCEHGHEEHEDDPPECHDRDLVAHEPLDGAPRRCRRHVRGLRRGDELRHDRVGLRVGVDGGHETRTRGLSKP